MHLLRTIAALLTLVHLASCGNFFSATIASEIQVTVEEAKKNQTLLDWENNKSHPKKIFQLARENDSAETRKSLCEGLADLSPIEIQIFQYEIENQENADLIQDCSADLAQRLEQFWLEQRKAMEDGGLSSLSKRTNPKVLFKTEVQNRDLTEGYLAVTGDVGPKKVIITFDDGPSGKWTPQLLQVLREYGVKAMFFMQGEHVVEHPHIVKQVFGEGHIVGSHSYSHKYLGDRSKCQSESCRASWVNEADAKSEIERGHRAIFDVLGDVAPFVRFPYGAKTPALKQFLIDKQIGEFFWNVDSLDWKPMQTNMELLNRTLAAMDSKQKGIIVLFHDVHRRTIETMPAFLQSIYERGYQPVVLTGSRNLPSLW
jgi:peptidoglycan/xylan/chitin deacetylase (PgdA/CDA1 family)